MLDLLPVNRRARATSVRWGRLLVYHFYSCNNNVNIKYNMEKDDSKQDAATTTAHSKSFIKLLKYEKLLTSTLSTIWKNTDGCAEQYICASALYIMSVLSQFFSIITD